MGYDKSLRASRWPMRCHDGGRFGQETSRTCRVKSWMNAQQKLRQREIRLGTRNL